MTGRARYGVMLLLWVWAGCGDDPASPVDSDGDNLSDADEYKLGTDPQQIDSDFDGVTDYSDDVDGDGISNAEELEAGTATTPSRSSGTQPIGTAPRDQDGTDDGAAAGASASAGAGAGDADTPADKPADQPADTAKDPATGQTSCDELWARCTKNLARACEAFVASCELPGCEDLKAACDAGSDPVCVFQQRKCTDSSGTGDGSSDGSSDEPAFCPDLRAACTAGSADACALVERDCDPAIDCAALELVCKAAGGVGDACDQLAAHCG